MARETKNLTVEILRQIRDEIVGTRKDLTERIDATNERIDGTNQRIGETNHRLEAVEGTLLELAQQQRFVVRGLRTLAERDHRLEGDIAELRGRVEAIEKRLG